MSVLLDFTFSGPFHLSPLFPGVEFCCNIPGPSSIEIDTWFLLDWFLELIDYVVIEVFMFPSGVQGVK